MVAKIYKVKSEKWHKKCTWNAEDGLSDGMSREDAMKRQFDVVPKISCIQSCRDIYIKGKDWVCEKIEQEEAWDFIVNNGYRELWLVIAKIANNMSTNAIIVTKC